MKKEINTLKFEEPRSLKKSESTIADALLLNLIEARLDKIERKVHLNELSFTIRLTALERKVGIKPKVFRGEIDED